MSMRNKLKRHLLAAAVAYSGLWLSGQAQGQQADTQQMVAELREEIRQLQSQMLNQQEVLEARIGQLEQTVEVLSSGPLTEQEESPTDLTAALERARGEKPEPATAGGWGSRLGASIQNMNPDASVIIDTFYYQDNSEEGVQHIFEELAGFGHAHGDDDHGHEDSELEEGFNMRHIELHLSADIDPYFRGWAIAAVSENSAELEEAVLQTTRLPWGLQLQGGKFYSDFSRINAQHKHEWDFVDAPLIHHLLFGDHGLNEKGLQLSWLAPTPFQLLLGIEALQGENERAFQHHGDDALSDESGPRLWVGWMKIAPNLSGPHGLQLGLAAGRGVHQEEHDELDNADAFSPPAPGPDGETDHWLDGHTTFVSTDVVYKYDTPQPYGKGDWTVQSGYMWRRKDLELVDHLLDAAPVGEDRIDTQDGYYAQVVYGVAPRWRAGVRWEQIGLTNRSELPDGGRESYGDSRRASFMVDFWPSEFSRLRLQVARGEYETADGAEDAWQLFLQWTASLGKHGAHEF